MKTLGALQRWGLYAFVFLLPLQTRWIIRQGVLNGAAWDYGTISIYVVECLLALLAALAAVRAVWGPGDELRTRANRMFPFYFLMLGLLAIAALSIAWSADRGLSALALLRLGEGVALVFIIAHTNFNFAAAAKWFVGGAAMQAALAVYQFMAQYIAPSTLLGVAEHVAGWGGASVVESESFRWLRAYGTLPHPNMLGGYLAIAAIVAVTLIFVSSSHRQRAAVWGVLALILNGLFFTFSRSAFLALGVGSAAIITFVMLNKDDGSKRFFAHYIFIALTTLGLLAVFHSDPLLTRVRGEQRLELQSVQERSLYLNQSRQLLAYNWLTGVGIGAYTRALYNQRPTLQAWEYQPVHNVYILILAETGIVGFVVFLLLLADAAGALYRFRIDYGATLLEIYGEYDKEDLYRRYNFEFHWFLGSGAVVLMCMALMLFDHYFWSMPFGIYLFWLSLGLFLKQVSFLKK